MYLDAVIENNHVNVIYNSTPESTKKFLLKKVENREDTNSIYVMDGATLSRWTVEEYLQR